MPRAPLAVVTAPVANGTVHAGTIVTIAADVVAPDGKIDLVEFYDGPSKLGTEDRAPVDTCGHRLGRASVPTGCALRRRFAPSTWSETVYVTAVASGGGVIPGVALSTPSDGQVFMAPASVPLSVSVSDPQGRSTSVDYVAGTQTVATSAQAPFAATWSGVGAGEFELTAIVRFDGNTKRTYSLPAFDLGAPGRIRRIHGAGRRHAVRAGRADRPAGTGGNPQRRRAHRVRRRRQGARQRRGLRRSDGRVRRGSRGAARPSDPMWSRRAPTRRTDRCGRCGRSASRSRTCPSTSSSPIPGRCILRPATVRIMANPALGTGEVAQVDFYGDDVLLGSRTAAPYVHLWKGVGVGRHTVSARVTRRRRRDRVLRAGHGVGRGRCGASSRRGRGRRQRGR